MRKEDKATVIEQITATLKEYSHIYLTETTLMPIIRLFSTA